MFVFLRAFLSRSCNVSWNDLAQQMSCRVIPCAWLLFPFHFRVEPAFTFLIKAASPKRCFPSTSSTTTWLALCASSTCVSIVDMTSGHVWYLVIWSSHTSIYLYIKNCHCKGYDNDDVLMWVSQKYRQNEMNSCHCKGYDVGFLMQGSHAYKWNGWIADITEKSVVNSSRRDPHFLFGSPMA